MKTIREFVSQDFLFEMGFGKKIIEDKVRNRAKNFITHIMRMIILDCSSEEYKKHLKDPLIPLSHELNDLWVNKSNNRLSSKTYFKLLYTDFLGTNDRVINRIYLRLIEKYKNNNVIIEKENVRIILKDILSKISNDMGLDILKNMNIYLDDYTKIII